MAARYIADELSSACLVPIGDSGYFQRVPLFVRPMPPLQPDLVLASSWSAFFQADSDRRVEDYNVVAVLPGATWSSRDTAILAVAHYDHHGIGRPVGDDSIMNGSDDNASGVAALVEAARLLSTGRRPRRSIIFLFTTGEEIGMLGTNWYLRHPVWPLERMMAVIGVEMVGRADSVTAGHGGLWLTGDERSTIGRRLRESGLNIVPDPRIRQRFYERSDTYAFALAGIPAHTLSSYSLHADYHRVTDEFERIDLSHLAAATASVRGAIRTLANGPVATWESDGRPPRQITSPP